jgi:hypothetical protein
MRFWKGECSRAFTDWRGLHYGVRDGAWSLPDTDSGFAMLQRATA